VNLPNERSCLRRDVGSVAAGGDIGYIEVSWLEKTFLRPKDAAMAAW